MMIPIQDGVIPDGVPPEVREQLEQFFAYNDAVKKETERQNEIAAYWAPILCTCRINDNDCTIHASFSMFMALTRKARE